MQLLLKEFVEQNYKKLKLSDKFSKAVKQHQEAPNILMAHYHMKHKLEHTAVEYTRCVIVKGSDE